MYTIRLTFCDYNIHIMHNIVNRLQTANFANVNYNVVGVDLVVCADSDTSRFASWFARMFAKEFVLFYKSKYINNNIHLSGKYCHILPKLLVMYELDMDIDYAAARVDVSKNIVVQSLFQFCCNILVAKWKNLVYIVDSNSVYFNSSDVAIEFISFLLDNISGDKSIDITLGDSIVLNYLGKDHIVRDEDRLLYLILSIVPKKINIYTKSGYGNSVIGVLYKLFNKKVNIVT